ncbi:MAG: SIR2 family protein [Planctomycetota bacterium]
MANVITRVVGSAHRIENPGASLAAQILGVPKPVFALIGAGISCAAKGPTWERLLDAMGEQLAARAKSRVREDVDQLEQFQKLRREHNLKGAGEIWKWSRIHYEEKQRLLNSLFANLHPGTIHRDLVSCGLRGILTLNNDHLLEDAYAEITGRSITPFLPSDLERQDFFFGDDFFIAKLHGDAARWESIVVGDTDYAGATWPKKANALVGGHTILVLGISLQDSIINEFLFGLPPNTHVHVMMPASEVDAYRQRLLSLHTSGMPGHISLHPLEHSELPPLIHALKPPIPADAHIDCSWSDLPPSGSAAVDFGQPAGKLRAFLLSDKRLAHMEQFSELAAAWRAETQLTSSTTVMCTHPAYQRIIGMGASSLPFIFRDLQKEPDHWFWALKAITGCDPVPLSHRGDLDAMAADWLGWARSLGYLES